MATLAPRDDSYDFEAVTILKLARRELRRSDSLAIVFDDNTSRQELLLQQKLLEHARQLKGNFRAVSDDYFSIEHSAFLAREGP